VVKRKHHPTWKWAFGNKRQKGKIRRFMEQGCGCSYCCAGDRRQKIRDRDERRTA